MKKIYTLILVLFAFNAQSQSVIYSENFDADSTALPVGWTTSTNGFIIETGNNSIGYTGATGMYNAAIRNLSPTGTYEMISKNISTTNYSTINILWASRVSNNFPNGGSAVQSVQWSNDNGATWNNILYNENTNNSTWALTNGGSRIYLPAAASNKPNFLIKWIVNIVNAASGTYRIDDFDVQGTFSVGLSDLESVSASMIFSNNTLFINNEENNPEYASRIYDITGKEVFTSSGSANAVINLNSFQKGLYIVQIVQKGNSFSKKIIIK